MSCRAHVKYNWRDGKNKIGKQLQKQFWPIVHTAHIVNGQKKMPYVSVVSKPSIVMWMETFGKLSTILSKWAEQ